MKSLQEYFKKTLGIELKLKALTSKELDKLPLYLRNNLRAGDLLGQDIILVEKTGLTPDQYKKQVDIIENALQKPVVFIVDNIESYNRNRLIQKKVGFIEPGRQMYIPNLLIDIKEYNKAQTKKVEKLPPAAQCLLFYYLLGNELTGINFKTIAEKLNYGTMTITRGANLLAGINLCKIEGGKEKRLIFDKDKNQLWKDAQPYLINPIKKEYYTDDNCDFNFVYKTGINALAYYSEIAAEDRNFYAVSNEVLKALLEKEKIELLNAPGAKTVLQIWKYNPGILASDHVVDPLSLYLTLKEINNERVQGELNKLINSLW
jgi:hypothetical protein